MGKVNLTSLYHIGISVNDIGERRNSTWTFWERKSKEEGP